MKNWRAACRRQATGRWTVAVAAWLLLLPVVAAARAELAPAVVAAAKKEGEVVVIGPPGLSYAKALKSFSEAYPEIRLSFTGINGRDAIPRLLRERGVGMSTTDIFVNGSATILAELKPRGALAPLRDALLDPDVTADGNWLGGFEEGWLDHEKRYLYAFESIVEIPAYVNWDHVGKEQLRSPQDFLRPEFAGKIVMDDPSVGGGAGSNASLSFLINFGEDYLRKLFRQKIVYTGNWRQAADWLVHGRYPIAIGAGIDNITAFQEKGLGKNITPVSRDFLPKPVIKTGFGSVAMLRDPPHPNAALLYANWLLSKEGQARWAGVPRNSRRSDLAPGLPSLNMEPGIAYLNIQHEDLLALKDKANSIAKETIATAAEKQP